MKKTNHSTPTDDYDFGMSGHLRRSGRAVKKRVITDPGEEEPPQKLARRSEVDSPPATTPEESSPTLTEPNSNDREIPQMEPTDGITDEESEEETHNSAEGRVPIDDETFTLSGPGGDRRPRKFRVKDSKTSSVGSPAHP